MSEPMRPLCHVCRWWGSEDATPRGSFERRCGNDRSVEFRMTKKRGDYCSQFERVDEDEDKIVRFR